MLTFNYKSSVTGLSVSVTEIPPMEIVSGISGVLDKFGITKGVYTNGDDEYKMMCIQAIVTGCVIYWANKGYINVDRSVSRKLKRKLMKSLFQSGDDNIWKTVSKDEGILKGNIINMVLPSYHLDKFPLWARIVKGYGVNSIDGDDLGAMTQMFERAVRAAND